MPKPLISCLPMLLAAFFLIFPAIVDAQEIPYFPVRLAAESAFVRAAPSLDAPAVASVFADDALRAVGRNVDGTWFQVARPEGWIYRASLTYAFDPALLPLTDLTTGVEGETPVVDSGFTVQLIDDAALRARPERAAQAVADIPIYALLPALERTPDNQWILVNYRGHTGWLPQFLARYTFAIADVPISPEFVDDPRYPAVTLIPVERQLAQIDRLLAYIEPLDQLADGVANYWNGLRRGQILECQPHTEVIPYYTITQQDLTELPELRQQDRRLREAVDDLNAALALTQTCGIVVTIDFNAAYADAMNARSIFRLVRGRMDALRLRIAPDAREQTGSGSG